MLEYVRSHASNSVVIRTIAKNLSWLASGYYVSYGLSIITVIVIARAIGPANYGLLSSAVAYVGLFAVFRLNGLDDVYVREIAKDRSKGEELFTTMLAVKLVIGSVAAAGILVSLLFIKVTRTEIVSIAFLSTMMLTQSLIDLCGGVFRGRNDMKWVMFSNLVRQATYVLAAMGLIHLLGVTSPVALSVVVAGSYFFAAVLVLNAVRRYVPFPFRLRFRLLPKHVIRAGILFSILDISWFFYTRVDILVARYMIGASFAGLYAVGLSMFDKAESPLLLVVQAAFPAIVSRLKSRHVSLKELLGPIFWFGVAGAGIALLVWMLAGPVVRLLFGAKFGPAIPAVRVLILALPLYAAMRPLTLVLQATHREIVPVVLLPLRGLLNVGLDVVLVALGFGIVGIAWATVITATVYAAVYFTVASRVLKVKQELPLAA